METIATTTCTTDASGSVCVLQDSTSSPTLLTYHDWLFVNGIQIFLLFLLALGIVFAPFNYRQKNKSGTYD